MSPVFAAHGRHRDEDSQRDLLFRQWNRARETITLPASRARVRHYILENKDAKPCM